MPAPLIVFLVIGLVAIAGLVAGLRGRRVGTAPHCARCRFELTGLLGSVTACPECGRSLDSRRAVRRGRRHRMRPLIAMSILVLLGAVTSAVLSLPGLGDTVIRRMPASVLIRIADDGGAAMEALKNRLQGDSLTKAEIHALAERVIARQEDDAKPFTQGWEDLLADLLAQDLLTKAQLARSVRNAIRIETVVRDRVRPELGIIPIIVRIRQQRWPSDPRLDGSGEPARFGVRFDNVTLDGEPIYAPEYSRLLRAGGMSSSLSAGSASGMSKTLQPWAYGVGGDGRLSPGPHTLTTTLRLLALDPASSTAPPGTDAPPIGEWTIEEKHQITIVPEGEPVIELKGPDGSHAAIARALGVSEILVVTDTPQICGAGDVVLCKMLRSAPLPMAVACDVLVRIPDGEPPLRIGGFTAIPGNDPPAPFRHSYAVTLTDSQVPRDQTHPAKRAWPDRVDVYLQPSTRIAYSHPPINAIHGGVIVFRDVPVVRVPSLNSWSTTPDDPVVWGEPAPAGP